jgi:hypothetical protein
LHTLGYGFAGYRGWKRINEKDRFNILFCHSPGNPLDLFPNTLFVKLLGVKSQCDRTNQNGPSKLCAHKHWRHVLAVTDSIWRPNSQSRDEGTQV